MADPLHVKLSQLSGRRAHLGEARDHHRKEQTTARAFTSAKKPFAACISLLAVHEKKLLTAWKRQLKQLAGTSGSSDSHTEIALWDAVQRVPKTRFQDFANGLSKIGDDLARREISTNAIVASISELQDAALQCLPKTRQAEAVALLRMTSLAM